MGLLARALEIEGIPATLTTWHPVLRLVKPPRATMTRLPRGAVIGHPNDKNQQRRVLEKTLALLEEDGSRGIVKLDEE